MVYVDNYNAPYRNMKMCHLIADSQTELLEFVKKIGIDKKWIQYKGTAKEHFDISLSKKKLAIENGAIEIGFRELCEKTLNRDWKK